MFEDVAVNHVRKVVGRRVIETDHECRTPPVADPDRVFPAAIRLSHGLAVPRHDQKRAPVDVERVNAPVCVDFPQLPLTEWHPLVDDAHVHGLTVDPHRPVQGVSPCRTGIVPAPIPFAAIPAPAAASLHVECERAAVPGCGRVRARDLRQLPGQFTDRRQLRVRAQGEDLECIAKPVRRAVITAIAIASVKVSGRQRQPRGPPALARERARRASPRPAYRT